MTTRGVEAIGTAHVHLSDGRAITVYQDVKVL
jgi:hypothetical protein